MLSMIYAILCVCKQLAAFIGVSPGPVMDGLADGRVGE